MQKSIRLLLASLGFIAKDTALPQPPGTAEKQPADKKTPAKRTDDFYSKNRLASLRSKEKTLGKA